MKSTQQEKASVPFRRFEGKPDFDWMVEHRIDRHDIDNPLELEHRGAFDFRERRL
jgi:hypothetical protein